MLSVVTRNEVDEGNVTEPAKYKNNKLSYTESPYIAEGNCRVR